MKPKLTFQEMINHLKTKGITFQHISEQEAKVYLRDQNYFYKLTAFRQNFEKINGEYIGLDFATLVDLSKIDTALRYFVLDLALDYEHAIKTKILSLITLDPSEDGYAVVDQFRRLHQNTYQIILVNMKRGNYGKEFYRKRHKHLAVWNLLEGTTMGSLSVFIDFYYKQKKIKSLKADHKLTKFAKNLRNAAAHNNALLINLFSKDTKISPNIETVSYAQPYGISRKQLTEQKLNDLFALVFLHKKYCSELVNQERLARLNQLLEQIYKNKSLYHLDMLPRLSQALNTCDVIVDILKGK